VRRADWSHHSTPHRGACLGVSQVCGLPEGVKGAAGADGFLHARRARPVKSTMARGVVPGPSLAATATPRPVIPEPSSSNAEFELYAHKC
jgi:hypothetical protein